MRCRRSVDFSAINSSQLGLSVLHQLLFVFRFLCITALTCTAAFNFPAPVFSQDDSPERAENAAPELNLQSKQVTATSDVKSRKTSAVKEPAAEDTVAEKPDAKIPAPKQQFKLARGLHVWARFEPGAWRELEIVTETFDESGQVVSRNVTLQKEKLMQVDNGKYVLNVQATVDLGGKKIVGDWKARILNLATDHAEAITETRRLKDGSFQLAGQTVACQVWEICYHDGTRKLFDRIHFSAQQFPYVLSRETLIDQGQPNDVEAAVALPPKQDVMEQVIEVTVPVLPYRMENQFLGCSNLLTYRLRSKGDSHRAAIVNETVPGGVVEIRSSDYDTEGRIVRWSITKLLGFGAGPPAVEKKPTDDQVGVEKASNEEPTVDAASADESSTEEGAAQRKGRRRRRARKIRGGRAAEKQDVPADSAPADEPQVF